MKIQLLAVYTSLMGLQGPTSEIKQNGAFCSKKQFKMSSSRTPSETITTTKQ
jgi:hypothetical protein